MNVPSRFDVAACRIKSTARCDRQFKSVNKQFRWKLLGEPSAGINCNAPCYRISSVRLKFSHACADCRQLLCWDACQFPCHLWRVDLEKRKSQILARARKHLGRRKEQTRLFRMKRRSPARFAGKAIAAIAF